MTRSILLFLITEGDTVRVEDTQAEATTLRDVDLDLWFEMIIKVSIRVGWHEFAFSFETKF